MKTYEKPNVEYVSLVAEEEIASGIDGSMDLESALSDWT